MRSEEDTAFVLVMSGLALFGGLALGLLAAAMLGLLALNMWMAAPVATPVIIMVAAAPAAATAPTASLATPTAYQVLLPMVAPALPATPVPAAVVPTEPSPTPTATALPSATPLPLTLAPAPTWTATVLPPAEVVPDAAAPGQLHRIGEDVVLGELRWKVIAAADQGQVLTSLNQFTENASSSGRFIRVMFELENLGKERDSFMGVDLADGQGRTFGSFSDSYNYIEEAHRCTMESLQPNLPRTCEVIFEVPSGATGLKLKINDNGMIAPKTDFIELGL